MRCRFPTEKLIITDSWTIRDHFFFSYVVCVLFLTMKLWTRWISPLEDTSYFLLFIMSPKKKWVKSPAG